MCVQVDQVPGGSGEVDIRCLSKDQVHQVLHVDQVDQVPTISEQSPRGERPKVEAVPLPLSLGASHCYVKVKET